MTRELVLQNIMVNYGKYGVTEKVINALIDSGYTAGLNYDAIYLGIKMSLDNIYGEEFLCTSEDVAKAFGLTQDEVNELIEQSRQELIEAGKNPDDYFKAVQSNKYMM